MGFGLFPTLFAMNFTWADIVATGGTNGMNREQARDEQVGRFVMVFLFFLLFSFLSFGSDVFLAF